MLKKRDPDQLVQLKFRVSEKLRAKIEKAANANGVSLAAEIETRLVSSFEEGKRLKEILTWMQDGMLVLVKEQETRYESLVKQLVQDGRLPREKK